eukprot:COSAG06_NODE_1448_length_9438_cov_6.747296_10_plen_30_part_00
MMVMMARHIDMSFVLWQLIVEYKENNVGP